jgi:hypothetical protein
MASKQKTLGPSKEEPNVFVFPLFVQIGGDA